MALSHVISEVFNVEKFRDLEIQVKSQSRSLEVVLFDKTGYHFLLVFYVTLSLRRTIFVIFDL